MFIRLAKLVALPIWTCPMLSKYANACGSIYL